MSPRLLTCRCGEVELALEGAPILTASCHCDDCQAAGAELEARPGAWPVRDAAGGTYYALYRKDRHRVTRGLDRLEAWKLRDTATNRMVATCCNSAMYLGFDGGPHWVSVYRPAFGADAPPLDMRVNTKFAAGPVPGDVPGYATAPLRFIWKLIAARIAMLFSAR